MFRELCTVIPLGVPPHPERTPGSPTPTGARTLLFCDPVETVYRAYGLLEGTPVEILFDAPDEYLRCETQAGDSLFESRREAARPMVDNLWLLPGEFVVAPPGRLITTHRFQYCEHWIDPRVHLSAIRFASGELHPAYGTLHPG